MPTPLDTSSVPKSFTRFPVKIHDEAPQIALSTVAAAKTFKYFARATSPHSSGPYGDACAISYPEGDIERVKLSAALIELLWIYDGKHSALLNLDVIETLSHDAASREHGAAVTSLPEIGTTDNAPDAGSMSSIFSYIGTRMHTLDPVGAPYVWNILKQFLCEYDSKSSPMFDTWEECLPFRVLNVAFRLLDALVQWTLGVYLTPEESEICSAFYASAGRAVALTNDYFSWSKEKRFPSNRGCSTVPVVRKQYRMSERDALLFVKGLAVDAEETTMKLAGPLKELSFNVKRYVQGVEYLLSGNCFWSATAPRYDDFSDAVE
ncbi:isoprenoid synthase domain-containing protein [Mycena rebaudengoi]|nr:isoprenoid synthase domain-containing protein [Mycena rebaudengoi]